jgi:hypothetical protein
MELSVSRLLGIRASYVPGFLLRTLVDLFFPVLFEISERCSSDVALDMVVTDAYLLQVLR